MAEYIQSSQVEDERDPQMPSDEQINAMQKKKYPKFSSQRVN